MCGRIRSLLSLISMGKYRMQLFYNGSDQYSSFFGGLVTIICYTMLIIYSIIIFASIFKKETYNLDKSFFPM
jgi:sorbitol-specific phosphotransferase system component IIC